MIGLDDSTLFESKHNESPTIWSSFMHKTDRDRIKLKQSPKHSLHGPMNQSPILQRAVSVHDLVISGVKRTSHRSLFATERSQNMDRYWVPSPHFVEHYHKKKHEYLKINYSDNGLTCSFQSEANQTPGFLPSKWWARFPIVEFPISVIGAAWWWCPLSLPLGEFR